MHRNIFNSESIEYSVKHHSSKWPLSVEVIELSLGLVNFGVCFFIGIVFYNQV